MQTPHADVPKGPIAYVRQIDPLRLPDAIRVQVPEGAPVWGVHAPDGACLALTGDRRAAFELARINDLTPLSVH